MRGQGILLMLGVCAVLLLIVAWRKKREWLLNFLLRGVAGTVGIYFINLVMTGQGYPVLVGINPATVLTCTVLGFPGLTALYGLQILYLL